MAQLVTIRLAASLALLCTAAVFAEPQHYPSHHPGGYHFSTFSGPVSGAVREIAVPHTHAHYHAAANHPHAQHHHGNAVDYVAKPDYSFAYGVEDPHTGNTQNHKESRDGDVVKGEYSVVEPDGSVRTVTYTSDPKNGFQANVHNSAQTHKPYVAPAPPPQAQQHGQYQGGYQQGGYQQGGRGYDYY